MIRGTTPTFKLKISDASVDLTQADNVYVSFSQDSVKLIKTGEDLSVAANEVEVHLSQEDSLKFTVGTLNIQLNWTYDNGERACTNIINIDVRTNLIGKVLE